MSGYIVVIHPECEEDHIARRPLLALCTSGGGGAGGRGEFGVGGGVKAHDTDNAGHYAQCADFGRNGCVLGSAAVGSQAPPSLSPASSPVPVPV